MLRFRARVKLRCLGCHVNIGAVLWVDMGSGYSQQGGGDRCGLGYSAYINYICGCKQHLWMTSQECKKCRPRAMSSATVFPLRPQSNSPASSLMSPCFRSPPCTYGPASGKASNCW